MDLWIRSQRKERLCKTSNFVIREANKQGYYAIAENRNKNTIEYGIYKTKERALEVLDEIHNILKPKMIVSNEGRDVYGLDGQIYRTNIVYSVNSDIQQLSTYVYEMPKE